MHICRCKPISDRVPQGDLFIICIKILMSTIRLVNASIHLGLLLNLKGSHIMTKLVEVMVLPTLYKAVYVLSIVEGAI